MTALVERAKRDPGLAFVVLAMIVVAAVYAPTLGHGLVNFDDPWLYTDNWIVQHPSWESLGKIWLDTGPTTRFVLGAEYLPVRDMSVMLDVAVWGSWYGGFHLTNLVLYLISIAVWFEAFEAFGVDRKLCGVMMLLWAVHPSHAESVAWLSERKGLLACVLAGVATLGYARFRAGARARWLVLGAIAAAAAIWSKAPAAFALAALGGLELVLPAKRTSWRRSLVGLAVIGIVAMAAFAPVVIVATSASVVGADDFAPAGRITMAIGLHGFYLNVAAMVVRNAIAYPITQDGPTAFELVAGSLGMVAALAVVAVPARGRWRPAAEVRAGAVLWLIGWFPSSRLVLPLRAVLAADRYLLVPSLGLALAAAAGLVRIADRRLRHALIGVLVIGGAVRALDAQSNWRDPVTLWERAVLSSVDDPDARSMYVEALEEAHQPVLAERALDEALARRRTPKLVLRKALMLNRGGEHAAGEALMLEAAIAGDTRAMSNLSLMLLQDGRVADALPWARKAASATPQYLPAQRTLGKVALAAHQAPDALAAFTRAYELQPTSVANRFNLALALIELHRFDEARVYLEACVNDPELGARARAALAESAR